MQRALVHNSRLLRQHLVLLLYLLAPLCWNARVALTVARVPLSVDPSRAITGRTLCAEGVALCVA